MTPDRANPATLPPQASTARYRDYAHPLWRRDAVHAARSAVIALLVLVVGRRGHPGAHFGKPITITYLLLDIAPILLIALPMTLIIITGEIDLSVASIVGLSSVLVGVLHQGGMPIEVAG